MTTAQLLFSVALAIISLGIVAFGLFVFSTTMWGDRWVRKPRPAEKNGEQQ